MNATAAGSIVFTCEALHPAIDEAEPMLAAHLALVTPLVGLPWEPHWWMFDGAEATGVLRTWTARRDGRLLGIAIFVVNQHPFFRAVVGQQQAFCLDPAERRGRSGVQFVQYVDAQLAADGCAFIFNETMPDLSPEFPRILERRGYRPVSVMMARKV